MANNSAYPALKSEKCNISNKKIEVFRQYIVRATENLPFSGRPGFCQKSAKLQLLGIFAKKPKVGSAHPWGEPRITEGAQTWNFALRKTRFAQIAKFPKHGALFGVSLTPRPAVKLPRRMRCAVALKWAKTRHFFRRKLAGKHRECVFGRDPCFFNPRGLVVFRSRRNGAKSRPVKYYI